MLGLASYPRPTLLFPAAVFELFSTRLRAVRTWVNSSAVRSNGFSPPWTNATLLNETNGILIFVHVRRRPIRAAAVFIFKPLLLSRRPQKHHVTTVYDARRRPVSIIRGVTPVTQSNRQHGLHGITVQSVTAGVYVRSEYALGFRAETPLLHCSLSNYFTRVPRGRLPALYRISIWNGWNCIDSLDVSRCVLKTNRD